MEKQFQHRAKSRVVFYGVNMNEFCIKIRCSSAVQKSQIQYANPHQLINRFKILASFMVANVPNHLTFRKLQFQTIAGRVNESCRLKRRLIRKLINEEQLVCFHFIPQK